MQWSCTTWRRNGSKVNHTTPNQLRRRREVFDNSFVQKKTQDLVIRTILWNSIKNAKSWFDRWEIYATQIRNTWNCKTSCTTSERRNFVSMGSVWCATKLVGRKAMECHCYLRFVQDLSAECHTLYERRFNSPFDGRLHRFGTKVHPGILMEYALNVWCKLDWWSFDSGYEGFSNNSTFWGSSCNKIK